MDSQELDAHLEELENRLDRLRALYEQYFLGIEKIEPTVARKDVDRRFWMMRRLQIRNTARRFRLQVLVQRYNTFQQYWARICREIENGTYKRHLARAEKRFGEEAKTAATRKRWRRRRAAEENEAAQTAASATEAAERDLAALLGSETDLQQEAQRAAQAALELPPEQTAATRGPAARDLDDLDLDLDGLEGPASARGFRRSPTGQAAAPKPPLPTPGGGPARPPLPRPAPLAPRAARPGGPAQAASSRVASGGPARPADRRAGPPPVRDKATPGARDGRLAGSSISDDRVRQLHAELTATQKKLNASGRVSVDGLAKTLRATEGKLKEKHKGGRVDFQVVVKDGQAVVRPVVRK